MNEETEIKSPAAAHSSQGSTHAGVASWRRYPHLEAAIETGAAALLTRIEQTRTEIEQLSRSGTAREQDRARASLLAYRRAIELLRELAHRRDQLLQPGSNMRS